MKKQEFIEEIAKIMKQQGFRKKGQYWFRNKSDYIECVCVQGSQWDKDDYYVNVGFAEANDTWKNPTELHWHSIHRCFDRSGNQLNILPQVLQDEMLRIFQDFASMKEVNDFLQRLNAVKVGSRLGF